VCVCVCVLCEGVKAVPYEWTIYVKGINNEDVSPFIKHVLCPPPSKPVQQPTQGNVQVTFVLHPSFDPREVEIRTPPYQLRRRGWGTFEIGVVITFKDGQTLRFRHQLDLSGQPAERLYDLSFPTQLLLPS
jgi:transcription initiation factor IIF auxiliary subunit